MSATLVPSREVIDAKFSLSLWADIADDVNSLTEIIWRGRKWSSDIEKISALSKKIEACLQKVKAHLDRSHIPVLEDLRMILSVYRQKRNSSVRWRQPAMLRKTQEKITAVINQLDEGQTDYPVKVLRIIREYTGLEFQGDAAKIFPAEVIKEAIQKIPNFKVDGLARTVFDLNYPVCHHRFLVRDLLTYFRPEQKAVFFKAINGYIAWSKSDAFGFFKLLPRSVENLGVEEFRVFIHNEGEFSDSIVYLSRRFPKLKVLNIELFAIGFLAKRIGKDIKKLKFSGFHELEGLTLTLRGLDDNHSACLLSKIAKEAPKLKIVQVKNYTTERLKAIMGK